MGKCVGDHHTNMCTVAGVLLCLLFHVHIHSCHDADIDATTPHMGKLKSKNNDGHQTVDLHITTEQYSHIHSVNPKMDFIKILFKKYGEGEYLTFEGFEHLLSNIQLYVDITAQNHTLDSHFVRGNGTFQDFHKNHDHHNVSSRVSRSSYSRSAESRRRSKQTRHRRHMKEQNKRVDDTVANTETKCLKPLEILDNYHLSTPLNRDNFLMLCPALVYQLDQQLCFYDSTGWTKRSNDPHEHHEPRKLLVWVYAFISVLVISMVGLLCVAVIPLTTKVFYNHLLQFLVALAVGSLMGDACLHLLPHAIRPHTHDDQHSEGDFDPEPLSGCHEEVDLKDPVWKGMVMLLGIYFFFLTERFIGLCTERTIKKKKSEPPSILKKINDDEETRIEAKTTAVSCEKTLMMVHPSKGIRDMSEDAHEEHHEKCDPVEQKSQMVEGYSRGHAHSTHGHSHAVTSIAWMVILGDGMHNFCDGLAIGASYAVGPGGGLSTTVAVLCHELPHELGDFAVLLRAGMTAKKAMFYNLVSSILCLFGMVIGVLLGNIESANAYICAVIGGSFIYVALVDMLPELKALDPKAGEHPLFHLALQNAGMFVGASIMLVIAIYEERIKFPI